MTRFQKILLAILGAGLVISVGIIIVRVKKNAEQKTIVQNQIQNGSGFAPLRTYYDVIGTAAAPAILTTSYNINSSTFRTPSLENLHLDIQYSSASTSKYALILIEGSNDNGTTFFPMGTKSVTSNQINLYGTDLNGAYGMPIIFPGAATSTSSTVYRAGVDFNMIADTVRVSAKESALVSSTLYIRAIVTSP